MPNRLAANELLDLIRKSLIHREESTTIQDESDFTPAAVLIILWQRDNSLNMLFTRRTDHLHHHPGQISFPGGRAESQDSNLTETALRETHEEIGLPKENIMIIGQLPLYFTNSGFCIHPVIGYVSEDISLKPDSFEVAEVFEVPLSHLLTASHYHRKAHQSRSYDEIYYNKYRIWGVTAGLLVSFRTMLERNIQYSN